MNDRDGNGMEMMLSAIASPIDDDFTSWQLADGLDVHEIKEEALDSAGQSPSSSLFDDFDDSSSSSLSSPSLATTDSGNGSLSSFEMMMNMFPDPTCTSPTLKEERLPVVPQVKKNVIVRRRARECSLVCWLFRTLLTSEYRALPVNAIYEIFEDTLQTQSTGHGRHYRQSIRHCLMTSAVFVRVLTPNPRKDFLVMNEQGSWWTVHPDCEMACAEPVFKSGPSHRCPPTASIPAYYSRVRMEESKAASGSVNRTYGYPSTASTPSSECSSTSSSSASSPAPSIAGVAASRRFDPIRRVGYTQMSSSRVTPNVNYRKYTGMPARPITRVEQQCQQPQLVNPRSILLNDISIDHEEVI